MKKITVGRERHYTKAGCKKQQPAVHAERAQSCNQAIAQTLGATSLFDFRTAIHG